MNDQLRYFIALTKVDKIGPINAKLLLAAFETPKNIFFQSTNDLIVVGGIGPVIAQKIKDFSDWHIVDKELQFIEDNEIQPHCLMDSSYPRRLRNYEDSPILLYSRGNLDLNYHRMVGVIGTRKPSQYGIQMTERMVEGLANYGATIVSGMAYGVDSIAHRKSVELGVSTIGILGHGLDRLYPATNRSLAKKMLAKGGLLTEFTSGTNPDRENFPMRNRIIAALSDAVVVIESKDRGGSIITTEFANAYNKDVFAVPGRAIDEVSAGCNRLIKSNKAHLAESAEDLAYIMRWEELDRDKTGQLPLFPDLSPDETIIMDALRESKEMTIDHLHYYCKKSMSEVSSLLLQLEFKGMVRSLPGKKYCIS